MKLSDGVILSVLTATAYLTAFAYEAGVAQALGVPIEMIDLQLLPALFTTVLSLSILLTFFQVLDPLVFLLTPKADEHPVITTVRPYFTFLVVVWLFWLVGGATVRTGAFWGIGVSIALALYGLLSPLLFFRRLPSYRAKLTANLTVTREGQRPVNELLFGSFGALTLLVLVSLLLTALSFTAGQARARRQTAFYVATLDGRPESVVLRIYGSRVIAAEFVRNERKIRRVYRVLKLDEPGLSLREETVGPLYLEALK